MTAIPYILLFLALIVAIMSYKTANPQPKHEYSADKNAPPTIIPVDTNVKRCPAALSAIAIACIVMAGGIAIVQFLA